MARWRPLGVDPVSWTPEHLHSRSPPCRGHKCRRQADRDLVRQRGQGRAQEQDRPPLGETRYAASAPAIDAQARPTSSARSARHAGPARHWCCRSAIRPLSMRLAEISQRVSAGAHAPMLLDQAGWHTSGKLVVPADISLLPLPPKSPELNPTEDVWQYLRDNCALQPGVLIRGRYCRPLLSHLERHPIGTRIEYSSGIKLVHQPWTIMSMGLRDWAHA